MTARVFPTRLTPLDPEPPDPPVYLVERPGEELLAIVSEDGGVITFAWTPEGDKLVPREWE